MNVDAFKAFLLNWAERLNDPEQRTFAQKRVTELVDVMRQDASNRTNSTAADSSSQPGSVRKRSDPMAASSEWPDSAFLTVDQEWKDFRKENPPGNSTEWAGLTMHRIDGAVSRVPMDMRSDLFAMLLKYLLEGHAEQTSLLRWIEE